MLQVYIFALHLFLLLAFFVVAVVDFANFFLATAVDIATLMLPMMPHYTNTSAEERLECVCAFIAFNCALRRKALEDALLTATHPAH